MSFLIRRIESPRWPPAPRRVSVDLARRLVTAKVNGQGHDPHLMECTKSAATDRSTNPVEDPEVSQKRSQDDRCEALSSIIASDGYRLTQSSRARGLDDEPGGCGVLDADADAVIEHEVAWAVAALSLSL